MAERDDEDADVVAAHGGVEALSRPAVPRDAPGRGRGGEGDAAAARVARPVGAQDRRVGLDLTGLRRGRRQRALGEAALGQRADGGGAVGQRAVDLGAQLGAVRDVGEHAGQPDREGDGGGDEERDAPGEGHGCSRST